MCNKDSYKAKNKNTIVSWKASDGKNLHPGGCKFIIFNQFD